MGSFSAFNGVSVTSLDCLSWSERSGLVLACGSENGDICVFLIKDPALNIGVGFAVVPGANVSMIHATEPNLCHGSTVRKLKFSPHNGNSDSFVLASCGDDTSVRVFQYNRA